MAESLNISARLIGLEKSARDGFRYAERLYGKGVSLRINADARSISKLSAPLGRITGQADEFSKSLDASTARVFAFGATVAVINGVRKALTDLVKTSIDTEKVLADINSVLGLSVDGLKKFSAEIFDTARNTGQSFKVASEAALELSRQGLTAEESISRLNNALVLARLSGLSGAASVESLTAAVNSFSKQAISATQIVNTFANVSAKFFVSEGDLAEAVKRVGSSAEDAGVSFNQLIAAVTAAQQVTARGGSIIGNAFKTIFTRLQRTGTIEQLESLGVAVKDLEGNALPAMEILQSLAGRLDDLTQPQKAFITELTAGVFQINQLKAVLGDLSGEYSVYRDALSKALTTTDEAIKRNEALNKTTAASINSLQQSIVQISSYAGNVTFEPLIKRFSSAAEEIGEFFNIGEGEKVGNEFATGILKGLGDFINGPGLALALAGVFAIIVKTAKFSTQAFQGLLGSLRLGEKRKNIQADINRLLSSEPDLHARIYAGAKSVEEVEARTLAILREKLVLQQQFSNFVGATMSGVPRVGSPKSFASAGLVASGGGIGLGRLPNFADPLNEAINREKKRGIPASQIYVDKDSRLKSASNPLGLLVANKRDEPLGGFQGVNRAIAMGVNPKTHGISSAGVPNFAAFDSFRRQLGTSNARESEFLVVPEQAKQLRSKFGKLVSAVDKVNKELSFELGASIQDYSKEIKLSAESQKKLNFYLAKQFDRLVRLDSRLVIHRDGKGNMNIPASEMPDMPSGLRRPMTREEIIAERNRKFAVAEDELFATPSFRENYLKKNLTDLSSGQIGRLLAREGLSPTGRKQDVNYLRTLLSSNSSDLGNINPDAINQTIGLSQSGTLYTKFEATVKKLIIRGETLENAYYDASKDLIKGGGGRKQLTKAQLRYVESLGAFERDIKAQRLNLKQRVGFIGIEERLSETGGDLSSLSRGQRRQLAGLARERAINNLGFSGIEPSILMESKKTQRLIARETGKIFRSFGGDGQTESMKLGFQNALIEPTPRFGGLFASRRSDTKRIFSDLEKAGLTRKNLTPEQLTDIRGSVEQRAQARSMKQSNAFILASLAGSFGSQLLPSGTARDTASGVLTGLSLGAIGGVKLGVVGALVGGGLGAASSVSQKPKRDLKSAAEAFDKQNATVTQNVNSAQQYTQVQAQLNEMIESGTGKLSDIEGLNASLSQVFASITDEKVKRDILDAAGNVEKLGKVLNEFTKKSAQDIAKQSLSLLTEKAVTEKVGAPIGTFKQYFGDFRTEDLRSISSGLASSGSINKDNLEEVNKALQEFASSGNAQAAQRLFYAFDDSFKKFEKGADVISILTGGVEAFNKAASNDQMQKTQLEYSAQLSKFQKEFKELTATLIGEGRRADLTTESLIRGRIGKAKNQLTLDSFGSTEISVARAQEKIDKAEANSKFSEQRTTIENSTKIALQDFIQKAKLKPEQTQSLLGSLSSGSNNDVFTQLFSIDSIKKDMDQLEELGNLNKNYGNAYKDFQRDLNETLSALEEASKFQIETIRRRNLVNLLGGPNFGSQDFSGIESGSRASLFRAQGEKRQGYLNYIPSDQRLNTRNKTQEFRVQEAQGLIERGKLFSGIDAFRTGSNLDQVTKAFSGADTDNLNQFVGSSLRGLSSGSGASGRGSELGGRLISNVQKILSDSNLEGAPDFKKALDLVDKTKIGNPELKTQLTDLLNTAYAAQGQIPDAARLKARDQFSTPLDREDSFIKKLAGASQSVDIAANTKKTAERVEELNQIMRARGEVLAFGERVKGSKEELGKLQGEKSKIQDAKTDAINSAVIDTNSSREVYSSFFKTLLERINQNAKTESDKRANYGDAADLTAFLHRENPKTVGEASDLILGSGKFGSLTRGLAGNSNNPEEIQSALKTFLSQFSDLDSDKIKDFDSKISKVNEQIVVANTDLENFSGWVTTANESLVDLIKTLRERDNKPQTVTGVGSNPSEPASVPQNVANLNNEIAKLKKQREAAISDLQNKGPSLSEKDQNKGLATIAATEKALAERNRQLQSILKDSAESYAKAITDSIGRGFPEKLAAEISQKISVQGNIILSDGVVTAEEIKGLNDTIRDAIGKFYNEKIKPDMDQVKKDQGIPVSP